MRRRYARSEGKHSRLSSTTASARILVFVSPRMRKREKQLFAFARCPLQVSSGVCLCSHQFAALCPPDSAATRLRSCSRPERTRTAAPAQGPAMGNPAAAPRTALAVLSTVLTAPIVCVSIKTALASALCPQPLARLLSAVLSASMQRSPVLMGKNGVNTYKSHVMKMLDKRLGARDPLECTKVGHTQSSRCRPRSLCCSPISRLFIPPQSSRIMNRPPRNPSASCPL